MKKTVSLMLLLLAFAITASAQKYEIECLRGDSTAVMNVKEEYKSPVEGEPKKLFYKTDEQVVYYLHDGDVIEPIARFDQNAENTLERVDYAVFKKDGKKYCTNIENLVFSEDNPEGAEDKLLYKSEKVHHTFQGQLFYSLTPYIIIALLFLGVMVLNWVAAKGGKCRSFARIAIPVCVMVATLLEVWAYKTIGSDCFWWCSKARYGFFGSLLRVIPFGIIVFYQIMSIKFYEPVLFGDDFDSDLHDGISVKPALFSILGAFPALVVAAIVCTKLKVFGIAQDIVLTIAFLLALGIGIFISAKRNIERVNNRKLGLLLTAFTIVYILGCVVAVWGLIVVILKLIFQIICIGVVLFGAMYFMSGSGAGPSSSGGGNVTYTTKYEDMDGHMHDTRYGAEKANEEILKNKH